MQIPTSNGSLPNGSALASFLAAGVGSAALGLATVLTEASPHGVKVFLNFYNPVGPLSGKTLVAVLVYFGSWAVLHSAIKGKNLNERKWIGVTFVLIATGLALTFPPIYQLF